ncbi:DUF5677 domain-containing protein (plasmid) [Cytobacillus solani]|uniref:DUF5677 domain-containing protein n=1 Tax=Cytobacillus solani TaxID=1637975 RepID=UPI0020793199|nr:DUF5677 domain-containing protein [Cytobacillus solani]USK57837.1 DUF5677 domain-containing protein [Cytobacillus solani]
MDKLLELCKEEYLFAKRIQEEFEILINHVKDLPETDQHILSATAFQKVRISYGAALQLCNLNFPFDAFSVIRSMFETNCILSCSCLRKEFAKEFKNSLLVHQERILNNVKKNPDSFGDYMKNFADSIDLDDLKKRIKSLSAKAIYVKDLAIQAGYKNLYYTFYAIASDYVHGSVSNFSKYISSDFNSDYIEYNTTELDIRESLLNANYMALLALKTYGKFLNFDRNYDYLEDANSLFYAKLNEEKYDEKVDIVFKRE